MDVQWRQEIPEDMRKQMITEMYVCAPFPFVILSFSKRKATVRGRGLLYF